MVISVENIELNESLPYKGKWDVIVAGGGVAGAAAALAVRRSGKSVLLLEKSMKFGGLATLGLINFFVPMCNGRGKQIIRGMAEEFLRLSVKYGFDTLPEEWKNGEPAEKPAGASYTRYTTKFSAEIFALALTGLLDGEGVDILFDSIASRPVMKGTHCDGVVVENKSGRCYYAASVVIDTTGDADILYRAGVPTATRGNFHSYFGFMLTLDGCARAAENKNIAYAIKGISGGNANLYGGGHPEGMPLYDGTDAVSVNGYIIKNQLEMLEKLKTGDRSARDVITLPGMAQLRTTRRIEGDYVLQKEDAYRHFDDSVGAICDFDRRDYLYEIPYRCLFNGKFDNLLTAGRSAAGNGYAWDVLRVIPPAIISGEAAGFAAAMAVEDGCAVGDISLSALQKKLSDADVMIHFDDSLIPEQA